ncbi:DNA adenine methylase [Synechocystis sp. PCC 7509]|uniref:DNA adenine methylase n=1 Tax=Synechocystis sp. PCC 7509 TaxID=927677 RepID=UPI0002AD0D66|nr:DNA adenine methylase [Synechocystis sp. PCC 7509]
MNNSVKSPLRYPGGKSRVVKYLLPYLPLTINDFREPFIGGGSVFIAFKSIFSEEKKQYWINDINSDLYLFWKYARDDINIFLDGIKYLKTSYPTGRDLYNYLNSDSFEKSDFNKAVRFFIMNRITFSGIMDSGGYSQQAFDKRFTVSSIERLKNISPYLDKVKITCGDYEELLVKDGKNVFLFLDPPYYKPTKSKLYGNKGDLHTNFDHERFAHNVKQCKHKWLLTYDDCLETRSLFSFANITELQVQYGMNNYKQKNAAIGKELIITNYSLNQLDDVQQLTINFDTKVI